jgi:hypothetical protein
MTEEQNSPSGENRTRVNRLAGRRIEGSEELARQGGSNNPKGGVDKEEEGLPKESGELSERQAVSNPIPE